MLNKLKHCIQRRLTDNHPALVDSWLCGLRCRLFRPVWAQQWTIDTLSHSVAR